MDWFKGKITGKPHISWENLWFPVDFPLNQSVDLNVDECCAPQHPDLEGISPMAKYGIPHGPKTRRFFSFMDL